MMCHTVCKRGKCVWAVKHDTAAENGIHSTAREASERTRATERQIERVTDQKRKRHTVLKLTRKSKRKKGD